MSDDEPASEKESRYGQDAPQDPFADASADASGRERRESGASGREGSSVEQGRKASIPYLYRRESVQEERERIAVDVQDETRQELRQMVTDLKAEYDQTVYETDVREAVLLAGIERVGRVEEILEEWGYGWE